MFDRPQSGGEKAVLVHIAITTTLTDNDLQEFSELAHSAGAVTAAVVSGSRRKAEPKYLFGESKAEEIKQAIAENSADLVLVNHKLSPAQERNLEKFLQCRVLDRTGLILDIFAQRASSHEGRLQVELAQLKHLSTRLVRGWTHLERQKGGIGLRGPGETQLETDRRLLSHRIKQLQKRLAKVHNQRQQGRKSRKKAALSTVSLVGYTNAGKSTLFNRLTESDVFASDQLFATLDPTLRRIRVSHTCEAILADTVGFIKDLPHELVEAFVSTLEETREAELLIHVIDASDPHHHHYIEEVNRVLKAIGAADVPQIEVFNKIDQINGSSPRIDYDESGQPKRVWLSAKSGEGIKDLLSALSEILEEASLTTWLRLSSSNSRVRAQIYAVSEVLEEHSDKNNLDVLLLAKIPQKYLKLLLEEDVNIESMDDMPKTVFKCN